MVRTASEKRTAYSDKDGPARTLATEMLDPGRRPSLGTRLHYYAAITLKHRWPEILAGVVALVVGVALGLVISMSTFKGAKLNRRITGLGQWNAWSVCSVTCGKGTRTRTRVFQDTDDGTKEDCPGSSCSGVEKEPCVRPKCCVPGVAGPELPFCYKVNETRLLNWNESREMAGRRGPTIDAFGKTRPTRKLLNQWMDGELVSIHSEHENEFVRNLIRDYGGGQYWIGLRCIGGGPNSCYWSDGSRVDYLALPLQFFGDGEPKCASIGSHGPLWQLNSCSNELYFVSKSWNVSSSVCDEAAPCYEAQTSTDKQTWDGAAKTVQLATIQSQQEMDHITKVVLNDAEEHMPFWVGLTCSDKWPDVCYWVDGSSLSYRKGLEGERDFVCGAVTKAGEFFLKDCNEKLSYIKESQPRCDKIGFPEWTAWSYECYNNSGQCGHEASGVHLRLRWTRYPDEPGCPTEPPQFKNETQPCILPCPVTIDTDIVVGPAEKATARVERKCDWFRLVKGTDMDAEMTADEQMASLRGSEDYWLMYQLFYDAVDVREFNKEFMDRTFGHGVSKSYWGPRTENDRGKLLKWCRKDCRHYAASYSKPKQESIEFEVGVLNPCLEPDVQLLKQEDEKWEAMGRCFEIDNPDVGLSRQMHEQYRTWEEARIFCGSKGGYLAPLGRNERDHLIVRYMNYHHIFEHYKVFIGLRRESDQWYWIGADGAKTPANATDISFEEDPNQTSELCGAIDFEHSIEDDDEPQTSFIKVFPCDERLNWICAWDSPEYLVNVKKTDDWHMDDSKRIAVENKRDWRRCRCEQFEGSDVVDVPYCYKVSDHKTEYQDIVVGQQINVVDGSAEMLDLVTIFNHVEQKQVEAVIQKDFEKNIEEQKFEIEYPCQSVYTRHPVFHHEGHCFVFQVNKLFSHADAIYKCDQGPDGRLADYGDKSVREALQRQLTGDWSKFARDGVYWSDLYAVRKEGDLSVWEWADGSAESSTSSFWQEGQPEDGTNADLQFECAVTDSSDGYKLTTQACKIRRKFICHSKKTLDGKDGKKSLNRFCSSSSKTEWKVLSLEKDCLVMPNHQTTFQKAQEFCEGYNSSLAILDRDDFYEQLKTEWKRLGDENSVGSDLAYVGLKLENHNWKWKPLPDQEEKETDAFPIPWSDGSPQRMQTLMTGGLCAVAETKHGLKMRPEKCENRHPIICQYSRSPKEVAHYWMGMFCEVPGAPRTCHWGDGTTVSLYHPFSVPDFERVQRLLYESSGSSDYSCVAIRAHRKGSDQYTFAWVPRNCRMKFPAVLEYFRSCHKWEFEGSGFGAVDRKKGWSSCPLVTGLSNALLGQCGTSTEPLEIFTAYELTFCMAFAGALMEECRRNGMDVSARGRFVCSQSGGQTWYGWRDGEDMLVELGSRVEYEYVARRLMVEGRGHVFSHIGAICQKTEQNTEVYSKWYECKWYKSGSTRGLEHDSPYWMKPEYKWRPIRAEDTDEQDKFTEMPQELCVAIYPSAGSEDFSEGEGMLVTVVCDDELYNSTAVLQFDKHYYDAKMRPTTSSNFPEFLEEFPDKVQKMDRPTVFYLTNALDATQ